MVWFAILKCMAHPIGESTGRRGRGCLGFSELALMLVLKLGNWMENPCIFL